MSAHPRTRQFQMPCVYRPKNEKVSRCKVGYALDKQGKRKRREFRLSADPLTAHKTAIGLQEKWMKEEERHRSPLAMIDSACSYIWH